MKWLHPILSTLFLFATPLSINADEVPIGWGELAPPEARSTIEMVGFERQQFTVQRVRGRVLIDAAETTDDVVERQAREIQLIESFDGLDFATTRDFRSWAKSLRGQRTYTYDNVLMLQPDGSTIAKPLVLLPPHQRAIADVAWNRWLAQQQALVEERLREQAQRQAELDRIHATQILVQQQTKNTERLADLEQQLARSARRRIIFVPQTGIVRTGTGLSVGGNQFGFVTTNVFTQ